MTTKRIIRAIAIILLIAAATALFAACGVQGSKAGRLVINEVVSSNKRSLLDENIGTPDWFELFNAGDIALELKGYSVTDDIKNIMDKRYVFGDITLQPGEYLIVYACGATAANANAPCTGFGLSKGGDMLYLLDPYFEVIEELDIPALMSDVSYARQDDGTYGYCGAPTPGAKNDGVYASMKALYPDAEYRALSISEVVPDGGDGYPWVELYNASDEAIRLEDYFISDDALDYMRWELPTGILEAHGYTIIYLSGLNKKGDEAHSSFKLGGGDDSLYLANIRGELTDELHWELGVPFGISVVEDYQYTSTVTMGAPNEGEAFYSLTGNAMDQSDPVRLSEALQNNKYGLIDMDGDRGEWAELFNHTQTAVSLKGYYLSDNKDDLYKWPLPDMELGAGEYLVVFLSGKNRTQGELHASFGLNGEEEALYLTRLDGMRIDTLPLIPEKKDDVSVGRNSDGETEYYGKPTPGEANAHGFAAYETLGSFDPNGIYINEVSAVSQVKAGQLDWVELYNGGSSTVDIDGWYLSDDPDNQLKWRISGLEVKADGYAVIEASSHPTRQGDGTATFGISPSGETLILSDSNGTMRDVFKTGALKLGVTSGRVANDDAGNRVFFSAATKGTRNAETYTTGYASAPRFSDTALYHTEPFTLELDCSTAGSTIRYTTDGSAPDINSPEYTQGLSINKTLTVRAAAFSDGLEPSETVTHTYVFDEPYTFPVVCVAMAPGDFTEMYSVIDRKFKIEKQCYVEFYEADGKIGATFNAGATVKGAGTLTYRQKSLSLHLRGAYGQSSVSYPFFDGCEVNTFSTLVLRNSGQDASGARMRNSFFSHAVEGMHLDAVSTRFCVVYINGKYYGIYDFEEDLNASYLAGHYGVDEDAVDVIRRNSTALDGSKYDFRDLRDFCRNADFSNDEQYEKLCARIDVDGFIDYLIAQTYFNNYDMFNQKYWRSQDNTVKWRPVYFDLDIGGKGYRGDILYAYFQPEGIPSKDGTLSNTDIYCALIQNASWRARFIERYVQVVYEYFAPGKLTVLLDGMTAQLEPEMRRHISRWGTPSSVSSWKKEVEVLREFIQKRPEYALENLRKYFGLTDSELDALKNKYSGQGI